MKRARPSWILWGLSALGMALAVLLLLRSLALASADAEGAIDVCSAVFGGGCDATLAGAETILGIPWAGWGAVLYTAIVVLLVLASGLGSAFAPQALTGAALLATFGGAIGLVLAGILLLTDTPLCPLCLLFHATTLALVPLLWRAAGAGPRGAVQRLRAAARFVLGARSDLPEDAPWKTVGFACAFLAAALAFQWTLVEWRLRSAGGVDVAVVERALRRWEAATPVGLGLRGDDPRLGPADAPAEVVVFSSLQCPGCEALVAMLVDIRRTAGDDMAIVFKHYPLSTICNPQAEADLHPAACTAAWAAEAARLQGRFWAFHDAVHADGLAGGDAGLTQLAEKLGLDMQRFGVDRVGGVARSRVRGDIELGNSLELDGTPSVFINGRPVHELRRDVLEALVDRAADTSR